MGKTNNDRYAMLLCLLPHLPYEDGKLSISIEEVLRFREVVGHDEIIKILTDVIVSYMEKQHKDLKINK